MFQLKAKLKKAQCGPSTTSDAPTTSEDDTVACGRDNLEQEDVAEMLQLDDDPPLPSMSKPSTRKKTTPTTGSLALNLDKDSSSLLNALASRAVDSEQLKRKLENLVDSGDMYKLEKISWGQWMGTCAAQVPSDKWVTFRQRAYDLICEFVPPHPAGPAPPSVPQRPVAIRPSTPQSAPAMLVQPNVSQYGQAGQSGKGYSQPHSSVAFGQSQQSSQSLGQSQQSGFSYGSSQQSGFSYGPSQQSGFSYGQSQQSGPSFGQSQQSVPSFGQSQQSVPSFGQSQQTYQSSQPSGYFGSSQYAQYSQTQPSYYTQTQETQQPQQQQQQQQQQARDPSPVPAASGSTTGNQSEQHVLSNLSTPNISANSSLVAAVGGGLLSPYTDMLNADTDDNV